MPSKRRAELFILGFGPLLRQKVVTRLPGGACPPGRVTGTSMLVPFSGGRSHTITTELADRTLIDLVFAPVFPGDLEKNPVPMAWDSITVRTRGKRTKVKR